MKEDNVNITIVKQLYQSLVQRNENNLLFSFSDSCGFEY